MSRRSTASQKPAPKSSAVVVLLSTPHFARGLFSSAVSRFLNPVTSFSTIYSISLYPSSSLILEIMAADAQQSSSAQGSWHELGPARENLVKEAEVMYWTGLKFELAAAANSLHEMLSQDPPLEELIDGSSSFLTLPKRLSVRMRPYVEAWCSYYLQYAEYLPFRN
jgi:hypothetical protein